MDYAGGNRSQRMLKTAENFEVGEPEKVSAR